LSESRYLNTRADAAYVGPEACAACHRRNHQSYLLTAHGRSLADLDPNAEPADGSFFHQASGHSYRVYRQDGQLRHEEVLRTAEGKEVARVDLPVRYLIGSGHYSRSYLVEVDGFLFESPITWYASKGQWGISPGYDTPRHWGFERPIYAACLACHVGRMESAGTVHRIAITEKAIGCENCHGPGSLHVALRQAKNPVAGDEDLTIVNPGKLPRRLLEAVCASCHLSGVATATLRGRRVTDFRPGMPLADYRADYRFDTGSAQMTVVGHMEQLRLSACYRNSGDMTCLTCHDPHAPERPKDPTAFYRQKCLGCHTTRSCGLDQAQRLRKDATDNCLACHMPRGDTDIPHIAFTDHRIGRRPPPPTAAGRVPELVPIEDVSRLSPADRQRNLGLAYLEAAQKPAHAAFAGAFAERARSLLEDVEAAGLRDGDTAEALAELYFQAEPARSRAYAARALDSKDLSVKGRADALIHLATCDVQDGNPQAALGKVKELVRLRRSSEDWGLLGACYLVQDKPREALPALQEALSIRPDSHPIHVELADVYRRLGDTERARAHRATALWLLQHTPN
jgi:hypothetical protein